MNNTGFCFMMPECGQQPSLPAKNSRANTRDSLSLKDEHILAIEKYWNCNIIKSVPITLLAMYQLCAYNIYIIN